MSLFIVIVVLGLSHPRNRIQNLNPVQILHRRSVIRSRQKTLGSVLRTPVTVE